MSKVYIVKALKFGDDPDAYENVRAFTSKKLALKFITKFIKDAEEDDLDITENEIDIEVLTLDN